MKNPGERPNEHDQGIAPAIRPICAEDYPRMKEFVRTLSRDTAYKRLLSGRTPADEEIRRWTVIDSSRECALVAVIGPPHAEQVIAVARYVMESPHNTDFAIVLADAWQGRGLGRELMVRLIAAASRCGVRQLSGITLSSNLPMLSLARGLGFKTTRVEGDFTTLLSLELENGDRPGRQRLNGG